MTSSSKPRLWPDHVSGVDDDVMLSVAVTGSFRVACYKARIQVHIGSAWMILDPEQAILLRDLLDAGIADAITELEDELTADIRVDLRKRAA
ncbi:hypothetical protein IU469_24825 [Nocardia puris]|uniref:hypothetical protein n=1 Tax=Nocardia puris TaxID=208602 RepID=UPI001895DAF5|nr:hypothetical protein [Nocardia puris]MBF6368917.1 hypothetical protein [Nocardia puris]